MKRAKTDKKIWLETFSRFVERSIVANYTDLPQSDTAALTIPELGLTLQHGTLGGRFTTVEGLLNQIFEELGSRLRMASSGDSSTEQERDGKAEFLKGLEEVKSASRSFTLILDDPLANSYVQNPYAPGKQLAYVRRNKANGVPKILTQT